MIGAALKRLTGAGADVFGKIEDLRSQIVVAKAELADLAALPVPRADAEAALDAAIARMGQQGADALTAGVASLTRPERSPDFAPEFDLDLLAALVVGLNPQAVRAVVSKAMDGVYRGFSGRKALPSMSERKKLAAVIEANLLTAELEEERLIRTVETAGISVLRRVDADPRAVLARIVE